MRREGDPEKVWAASPVAIYKARKITAWTVKYSSHVTVPTFDSSRQLNFELSEEEGDGLDLPCLMIISLASTSVSKWQAWEQSGDRPKLTSLSVLHHSLFEIPL